MGCPYCECVAAAGKFHRDITAENARGYTKSMVSVLMLIRTVQEHRVRCQQLGVDVELPEGADRDALQAIFDCSFHGVEENHHAFVAWFRRRHEELRRLVQAKKALVH